MKAANTIISLMCIAWLMALWWIAAPGHRLLEAMVSQTTAAWVQAIGSVAAILAVIWLQRRDHAHDAQLVAQQDAEQSAVEAEALNLVILEARYVIASCEERSIKSEWKTPWAVFASAQTDSVMRLIETINFKKLPNRHCVAIYIKARQVLMLARQQLESIIAGLPKQPKPEGFTKTLEALVTMTEELAAYVPERR